MYFLEHIWLWSLLSISGKDSDRAIKLRNDADEEEAEGGSDDESQPARPTIVVPSNGGHLKSPRKVGYTPRLLAQPIVADRGLHHLSFRWNLFVSWFIWFLFVPLVLALLHCTQYSSNRWCEQMLIAELWYLSRWQLNLPLYLQYHQEQKSCSRWVCLMFTHCHISTIGNVDILAQKLWHRAC